MFTHLTCHLVYTRRQNLVKCGSDRRALPSQTASGCRVLGALYGGTDMTIDIIGNGTGAEHPGPVNVTLYSVDWEKHGRRMAIEIRDYDFLAPQRTLQILAPTARVENFEAGCKLRYG